MISIIQEGLLKSAELTGIWEKKLRQIEKGTYEARTFLEELKQMVNQIVSNVLSDQTCRSITIEQKPAEPQNKENSFKASKKGRKSRGRKKIQPHCPLCKKGSILRGKVAYGCSEYKNGCIFRLDYATYGANLTDEQLAEVIKNLSV